MKVGRAEFIGAATEPGRFPPAGPREVAFAGRSNVGKSSAINRILGRRGLARTSSTPGRTQQLNFFAIDDRVVFVDLPGYGYAKVPKALRAGWGPLVESYLEGRAALAGLVLLIDVRRGFEEEEQRLLDFAAARDLPLLVIATKVDKLRRAERVQAERAFTATPVPVVPFSAVTGEGVDDVWRAIATWTARPGKRG
ncbi:MAG TPA: ribosome biogenesis GTP-binding protein YihA/YsxC [Candidatus Binatia bacterium]|jgi:GTP-binding protein